MARIAGTYLDVWDMVVILAYFVLVLFIGIYASFRKKVDISSYFLASRSMHWIPVGASLFASNIGSGHFIGLAGAGASSGIGVAGFELIAIFSVLMLGWVFVPVYMSSRIYTMPEYLRERFGGQRIRIYLSFLTLLLYIFTKISADLYAGALFIQNALNKNTVMWLYISIIMLLAVAAVFTIAGGLTAVMWTDFVQTILMITGSLILMGITFYKVGGVEGIIEEFPNAIAANRSHPSCGIPPKDYMNLFRSPKPLASDLPWPGLFFGKGIGSIWYWCADQVIVQRTLGSKNLTHAKAGCLLTAYFKLLPLWLMVFPGMASRILFKDRVGCADPDECFQICRSRGGCTNIAYVELVIKLLPAGLKGLMLAVMLAALMSSLTSIFNSASTIFTIDIWTRFRKNPSEYELITAGRIFVAVLIVTSVIWIPVIENATTSRLFDYIQSISSFLSPPICSVFILAIFWPRTNEAGAFWGLMVGLLFGLLRFAFEFIYTAPKCSDDITKLNPIFITFAFGYFQYLNFGLILLFITGFVTIIVSLLTEPIPDKCLHRLTFWSRMSTKPRESIKSISNGYEMKTYNVAENEIRSYTLKNVDVSNFLYEDPKWKRFVNINATICVTIVIFVIGFFS